MTTEELLRPHVLVIDDEPLLLELMRELLEGEGFRVSTRACPPANRDEIARLSPHLILVDYFGVGRATGWELLQRLKGDADACAIPLVLCTGAVHDVRALGDALRAMDVPVVLKPFAIDELLKVMRVVLAAPVAA